MGNYRNESGHCEEKTMSDEPKSQLLSYQAPGDRMRLEVWMQNETVWLTQSQMAVLFQASIPNVSMHIRNVFSDGEFWQDSVVKESLITAAAGISRSVLDPAISRERRERNESQLKP
jgi:hypothetical protein